MLGNDGIEKVTRELETPLRPDCMQPVPDSERSSPCCNAPRPFGWLWSRALEGGSPLDKKLLTIFSVLTLGEIAFWLIVHFL